MHLFARYVLICAIALAGVVLGVSASHADTIYDFQAGITTGSDGQPAPALSFVLTLDGDFQPGSFSRNCDAISCGSETGSFADFTLSAFDDGKLFATLDEMPDPIFDDTNGYLLGSSGALQWNTDEFNFDLTFGSGIWSASVISDKPPYFIPCSPNGCQASGDVSAVPEPGSLALLGSGLLVLGFAIRPRVEVQRGARSKQRP